jgi:DNA polymerase-1
MKDTRFDPGAIRGKYGLSPEELMDVKALAGDPSDNIPGVPGIGEKTALKLISRFHSLENVLAHVDEVKEKKVRERLKEHAEQARLSRELVQLKDDVPLTVDLEKLHPGAPDREALRHLFVELEKELKAVVSAIRRAGEVALFFLIGDGHPVLAQVAGLGLSWGEGEGAYIPLNQALASDKIWQKLGPLWSDPEIKKIGPDLKTARLAGERFGQDMAGAHGDILLASYLLNPARY